MGLNQSTALIRITASTPNPLPSSDYYQVLNLLGSSSSLLLGSMSNSYLHIPILNIRGIAGRPDSREDSGGFLLGIKPDIVFEMKALVRLILDMKLARDALDGRQVYAACDEMFIISPTDTSVY